jgi:DNA polymerase/3'-5' exonuclease PolX
MNKNILSELSKLIEQIKFDIDNSIDKNESNINSFRLRQIKNAYKIIQNYKKNIKKGEELQNIKGIGKGTIDRINEILKTGKLKEIKINKKNKESMNILDELETIVGIGRKTAIDLYKIHKIKSIKELKEAHKNRKIELNKNILLGLKYHNVYTKNIPRELITEVDKFLHNELIKIDPQLFGIITGSYRRLKMTSGDIDFLLVHPKIKTMKQLLNEKNYLQQFANKLKKSGFVLDDLTDKEPHSKYMGFAKFKNVTFRFDMRYVPYDSYYPALIYFTGSANFNRKMRMVANDMGYILNEYGLYELNDGIKGKQIKVRSENDLFEILGFDYLTPELRL